MARLLEHSNGFSNVLSTNGTGNYDDKTQDIIIYISVVAVFLLFSVVLSLLVLLFWLKRRRMRSQIRHLIGSFNDNSYGSMNLSTSIAYSHQENHHYSSSGKTKSPPIFILYALELETFNKVTLEDYPTYSLVLDLADLLSVLNLPCYHDGSEYFQNDSMQDFSGKVKRAVEEVKAVIVICSEVLHVAFSNTQNHREQAQMKYGKFDVSYVKGMMTKSTQKFVPVTLTGVSSVCLELQSRQCFNLKNYDQFMSSVKTSSNPEEVLRDPSFSEIRELAVILKQLLSV